MHIQHDVARFAVRQGMWTVVKNLCKGYRDFHKAAAQDPSLLRESVERVAADADAADAAREAQAAAQAAAQVAGVATTPKRTPGAKRNLVKRLLGLGPKVEAASMGPKRVSLHQMPPHLMAAERSAEEAATAASAAAARPPQKPHPVAAAALFGVRLLLLGAAATVVNRRNRKHKCTAYGPRRQAAAVAWENAAVTQKAAVTPAAEELAVSVVSM
jgi:hypothetical protein